MMKMLKDTKYIKNHRQACRYFANLSYYKSYTTKLLDRQIVAYLLSDIEKEERIKDEETIKYSVITLANLSCHENFMIDVQQAGKRDSTQISKVARSKIRPLIHLLDSTASLDIQIV